jgi:large subunit ribosomal protein L24
MRKKKAPAPNRIRVKKNDNVRIMAGRDKGKTGRVLEVNRKSGRVLVEGISLVKRHTRPNPSRQIKGGIAERESPVHVSNVMLVTSGGLPTRIGMKVDDTGASVVRTRIARRGGEILDKKA